MININKQLKNYLQKSSTETSFQGIQQATINFINEIKDDLSIEGFKTIEKTNNINPKEFMFLKETPYIISKKYGFADKNIEIIFFTKNENIESKDLIESLIDIIYFVLSKANSLVFLRKAKITDALTGCLNTMGLVEELSMYLAKNKIRIQDYNVMFFNIKNFNYFNKTFGQRYGNEILINFAKKIESFIEKDCEFIARAGGDNFFLVVKKSNFDKTLDFLKNISVEIDINGLKQKIKTPSRKGICIVDENSQLQNALDYASLSLNIAKQTKKDEVFYNQKMFEQILFEKSILGSFNDAIKNKEFVPYIQPKVNSKEKKLIGGEALVRWVKDGQLIPPYQFIPLFEREKLVIPLDFYMLDYVCMTIRDWLDKGIEPVKISINFSNLHFEKENFIEEVVSIIKKYNIDGKYLEIELTESTMQQNMEVIKNFIKTMKEFNISISIDDFGTGYSSLMLIKELDANTIKLDKSFVDKILNENQKDLIFIKNIINLINDLEMDIIAEGVEEEKQIKYLQDCKCYNIQGYYYDKPLPLDMFEERLKNRYY